MFWLNCIFFGKETLFVLKTPSEDINSLEIQIYDTTQNPCRLKDTWNETKWDAGITAIALYDFHVGLVVPEKGLAFTASN